jgi:hypothetical protein
VPRRDRRRRSKVASACRYRDKDAGRLGVMSPIGWLIVAVIVVVVAVLIFVVVRRRRRAGGVIATKGKR